MKHKYMKRCSTSLITGKCVHDSKKCRTIHIVCEENKGIKTDESYEEICNKIRDAVKEC